MVLMKKNYIGFFEFTSHKAFNVFHFRPSSEVMTARFVCAYTYRKVSYIRRTVVGNKIVDHSDVVGASPVGAAPTTSSFST